MTDAEAAAERARWDSYFWPGTTVLRNKLGIVDKQDLHAAEYRYAAARENEILLGNTTITPSFDAEHVSAVHQHLFGDIYDWAGQWRTVGMVKSAPLPIPGDPEYVQFSSPNQIGDYLHYAHGLATRALAAGPLDPAQFADRAAAVYSALNVAHPAREGNGRAGKIVMKQFARAAGYDIDYRYVHPVGWNRASMLSMPAPGEFAPRPQPLVAVFAKLARPLPARTATPQQAPSSAVEEARRAAQLAHRGQRRYTVSDARCDQDSTPNVNTAGVRPAPARHTDYDR